MNLFVAWQALTLWPNFDDWISVLFPRPSPYLTGAFYFPDLGSSQSEGYTSAQKLHKLEKKKFPFHNWFTHSLIYSFINYHNQRCAFEGVGERISGKMNNARNSREINK